MGFNKTLTAVLLSSALVFPTAVSPAAMANAQPTAVTVQDGAEQAKELTAEQRAAIDSTISDGDISLNTDSNNLAIDEAIAAEDSENQTLVMIPIKNEGTEYSNLSIVLDGEQELLSYSEAHFVEKDSSSGHVTAWVDGKKTIDRVVDSSEATNDDGVQPQGLNEAFGELNRCLASAGIPAWIIAAATTVCSFGSVPGIIACMTALGVGGGTAGYCGAAAWDKL